LKSGEKVMKWQIAMALDFGLRRHRCSMPYWKIVPWAIWVAVTKSSSEPHVGRAEAEVLLQGAA
jgi:hypothetical protein